MKNVCLQIKKKEFEMIKSGTKKTEWRAPSKFNKARLFKPDPAYNDQLNGDPEITQITFINGMKPSALRLIIEVAERIRMVKFQRDVDEPENNFHALKDQFAIQIKLGKIIG